MPLSVLALLCATRGLCDGLQYVFDYPHMFNAFLYYKKNLCGVSNFLILMYFFFQVRKCTAYLVLVSLRKSVVYCYT